MSEQQPLLVDDDNVGPPSRPPEEINQEYGLGAKAVSIVAAIIIPVILIIFYFSFLFLKDEDANKGLKVILAVVGGHHRGGGPVLGIRSADRSASAGPRRMPRDRSCSSARRWYC